MAGAKPSADLLKLRADLQAAIELEHSTIPPYLCALYTLKPGTNGEIAALVASVVQEEMLHMALAANLLNAVGGEPSLNHRAFVPTYPGHLPGGVRKDLTVGLQRFSLALARDTFMSIEAPHDPLNPRRLLHTGREYDDTIGQFYQGIERRMDALQKKGNIFTGDPGRQVEEGPIFAVRNVDDARRAIREIVDQGEGMTRTDPMDEEGELAHYYRFEEIVRGRRLVKGKDGWGFTGDPIPFDPAGVWPMVPNPRRADVEPGSVAQVRLDAVNAAYWRVLNGLHETFNGKPGHFKGSVGGMFELKSLVLQLVPTLLTPDVDTRFGYTAGPSFEYVPVGSL